MMLYKVLPTNTRPMPLEVPSEEFVNEYFECWRDPERPTALLYQQISPFISHWEEMLRSKEYEKDINYITLCRRLYSFDRDPQHVLSYWVDHADKTSSVREELEMLFFVRLRALKYYPKKAVPRMAEYVIAKDFRDRLKDLIMSSTIRPIDVPSEELTFNEYSNTEYAVLISEDPQPDHLMLQTLGLDAWESYLLELLKLGMNTMDISALTHLPRRNFLEEENEIWLQLKQIWLQA